jgi:hypothetical protein
MNKRRTSKDRAPCFMENRLLEEIRKESSRRNTSVYRYTNYLIENALYIENILGIPLPQVRETLEVLKALIDAGGIIVPVTVLQQFCDGNMWRIYGKSVGRLLKNSKKNLDRNDIIAMFQHILQLIPGNSLTIANNSVSVLSTYLDKKLAECISNFFYAVAEVTNYSIKIDIDENYLRVNLE